MRNAYNASFFSVVGIHTPSSRKRYPETLGERIYPATHAAIIHGLSWVSHQVGERVTWVWDLGHGLFHVLTAVTAQPISSINAVTIGLDCNL